MAKINATYGSGYYLAPDTDYRKLEEEQSREKRRKRQLGSDSAVGKGAIRQTFAIPFNIICLHCNSRIARGTHVYVNRRATSEKYMGIRIWELEFRCIFCKSHLYLTTDYETAKLTGGYHCSRSCKRGEGDFYGVNQTNEAIKAMQAAKDAEKGTIDALERENEVARQLQERERLVEEFVEAKAAVQETQTRDELLEVIRFKKKRHEGDVKLKNVACGAEVVPCSLRVGEMDGVAECEEEREEQEYRRFEEEMQRWKLKSAGQFGGDVGAEPVDDEVAVSITARYVGHEGKKTNVFMDSCDSDEEDANGSLHGASGAKKCCLPSANASPVSLSKECTRPIVRGTGALLSSLQDD
ncbi:putative Family of uncharacterized function [Trypanosoma vivax]|uniref:Splicing factor YJU2 n=1 Tax=Trypanosoma vivax (strain Y486) TaxID=1055687 RepID=G0TT56_TRYVY|nr:hypothetical protein TRVL_06943 [Trypanosoma vivax]KAH8619733.1 putative Family of uncharacterized function [Trypanosoma vivax]CCC47137.1 conserved hypothetical protein [Trypanosoma vivax Y486]